MKKNRFRESLISRIEEFEGFHENKISRTEASSVFTFHKEKLIREKKFSST